jgi:hypothetical protein
MTERERIEIDEYGEWRCLCGNVASTYGFFPCDVNGKAVEPTEADWPESLYICDGCGRIISDEPDARGQVVRRVNLDAPVRGI